MLARTELCLIFARTELQEEVTSQAPVFTSSPKSVEVKEGQKVHFEARIIPVSDPTLKVEWFLNGQPIKQGSSKIN
jgi:titin